MHTHTYSYLRDKAWLLRNNNNKKKTVLSIMHVCMCMCVCMIIIMMIPMHADIEMNLIGYILTGHRWWRWRQTEKIKKNNKLQDTVRKNGSNTQNDPEPRPYLLCMNVCVDIVYNRYAKNRNSTMRSGCTPSRVFFLKVRHNNWNSTYMCCAVSSEERAKFAVLFSLLLLVQHLSNAICSICCCLQVEQKKFVFFFLSWLM